jgi:hypothetical protein
MHKAEVQADCTTRASRVSVITSVVLLLLAMMLPVCHLHPLLDKSAPGRCTICMSLHATPPMGVHVPPAILLFQTGRIIVSSFESQSTLLPHSASSRAPPSPAC